MVGCEVNTKKESSGRRRRWERIFWVHASRGVSANPKALNTGWETDRKRLKAMQGEVNKEAKVTIFSIFGGVGKEGQKSRLPPSPPSWSFRSGPTHPKGCARTKWITTVRVICTPKGIHRGQPVFLYPKCITLSPPCLNPLDFHSQTFLKTYLSDFSSLRNLNVYRSSLSIL